MYDLPSYFYDVNIFSVTLRLILAVIFGGIIGLERGANRHAAGFRTHILVCVGAALAMLTNQFISESFSYISDPSRMGAQVITGVGFLGVGTILVTGRHRIKGLTTAAGLWASACTGLALGIGFYYGALIAGILVFISLALLPKVENYFYNRSRVLDLYVEFETIFKVKEFLNYIRAKSIIINESHISKEDAVSSGAVGLHLSIKIPKEMVQTNLIEELSEREGIYLIEEI